MSVPGLEDKEPGKGEQVMTVKDWQEFVAFQVMELAEAARRVNRMLAVLEQGTALVKEIVRQDLEELRDDLQEKAEMGLGVLRRQQAPPADAN